MIRMMVIALKYPSRVMRFVLTLILGAGCVVTVVCGGGKPAPPAETNTPVPTETSTPPPPQVDTPFGRLEVAAAEVVDKYPPDCVFSCNEAKTGYELLVVKLNVIERAKGDNQDKPDSLCEGAYVTAADGTMGECTISKFTVTLLQGSFFELVFTPPEGAEGLTLHVPDNDPIALPTPSGAGTATPSP
jgi:hypothetical protein